MDRQTALNEKTRRMTTDPVEGLICRMAIPTIAIMMISALYNMADTYFVGRLGTSATAAVGVSFALMGIIQAMGFFFGQGAGNYISRQMGAGDFADAARMAATGFFASLVAGAVIAALGHWYLPEVAVFLGSTETILPHAKEYLYYILLAAPWMTASLALNTMLRYQGSALYGMVGMLTGAVVNIILDPILIFGFDMGVAGASLATMCSQMLGFGLLLAGCYRKGNIPVRLRNLSVRMADVRFIAVTGFPSLCRQGLASIAAVSLNQMAGSFGDAAIAAMSIVQRVGMFGMSALLGWGQGFQPVCGFNYGARRYDRVRRAFWFCVKSSSLVLLLLAVAGFVFSAEIITLFRGDDPEVVRIGSLALRFQAVMFPFMGWVTLNNMMMQSVNRPGRATVMALARQGLFLLPILFLLTPRLGILGIQLAQPLADVATLALSIPLGIGVLRELDDPVDPVAPAGFGGGTVPDVVDDM